MIEDDIPSASPTDSAIIARATGSRARHRSGKPAGSRKPAKRKGGDKRVGPWRRFGRVVCWIAMIVVSAGMFASGFGGYVPPTSMSGISPLVLTFPAWVGALLLMTIITAIFYRTALLLALITWVGCLHPILEYSPLNFDTPSPDDYPASSRFTFLTYNITNFSDLTGRYDGDVNTTLSYIMRTNADIVNLQEAVVPALSQTKHFTAEQLDSLHVLYPYIIMYGKTQMMMSKFPVTVVHTGEAEMAAALRKSTLAAQKEMSPTTEIAVFRVDVRGTQITVFDVHLQSYSLSVDDKTLYREITDIKDTEKVKELKSTIREVRKSLYTKVQEAAELRQEATEHLVQLIDHYGGPNIIVAGDFNDVPGCYAINRLEHLGFNQVYAKVGFGPMITFNANRFWFRIDHVMYRGALEPLNMVRGNSRASDHYPLLTTFAITNNKNNKK